MIRPPSRKNWLTFGADTDYGSLFHFSHHCGIGNFRSCIRIYHKSPAIWRNDWRR